MTRTCTSASSTTRWQKSNGVWSLLRAGRCIAVIEPSWDDRYWCIFAFGDGGEPFFVRARRRIILRVCLLLWARDNNGLFLVEEAPL